MSTKAGEFQTRRMRALAISAAGRWESLCLAGVISSISISCIEDRYSRPQKPPSAWRKVRAGGLVGSAARIACMCR